MDPRRHISIMGILNLTEDSFFARSRMLGADGTFDEGLFSNRVAAMLSEGAEILDLGAISTRPGAAEVSLEEEWRRLEPALRLLRRDFPSARFSVDTTRSGIVSRVYDLAGAFIVNDISAGEDDAAMLPTAARLGLEYIAMHKRGTPATMQSLTDYTSGVVPAVVEYFRAFSSRAEDAGLKDWILDPGFGFAKTVSQNYELLAGLPAFTEFGRPILVGVSRKSMIYKPLGITPEEALPATQVIHFKALEAGADILRVHDVAAAAQTVQLYRKISEAECSASARLSNLPTSMRRR